MAKTPFSLAPHPHIAQMRHHAMQMFGTCLTPPYWLIEFSYAGSTEHVQTDTTAIFNLLLHFFLHRLLINVLNPCNKHSRDFKLNLSILIVCLRWRVMEGYCGDSPSLNSKCITCTRCTFIRKQNGIGYSSKL